MANFLRFLFGLALLPACWGMTRTFLAAVPVAAQTSDGLPVEALFLLGGIVAFAACWLVLSHPIRTYVLGHELTHALWGLLFGAIPSKLKVGVRGGSVRLSKSNFIITLAPYFFPFYTFVVILVALLVYVFVRPLPWLPLWMFLIGFTWAFHILFTLSTLTLAQPDVQTFGRGFSWAFIYLANVALVLGWLASTTPLTFADLAGDLVTRVVSAYFGVAEFFQAGTVWLIGLFSRK